MGPEPRPLSAVLTRGLTKDYGGVGLFDLDLRVETGTVYGFLGPNGSGKSTALRLLLGHTHPHRGQVSVLGLDPWDDGPRLRAGLGYLPGELRLWPAATPRRVLAHLAALRGGVDPQVLGDLCDRFSVALDRPVRTLSTGNKQKVGIVQAFMHRPALVVLDEPTKGLDPLLQREFQALVQETAADGRTVLLSSHTLSEVERVATRVGVLRAGRLVAEQSVAGLRSVAVRRVHAELTGPVDVDEFLAVQGVEAVEVHGRTLSATVTGQVDPFVKVLARHTVESLAVEDADLEEVFLSLYRDHTDRSVDDSPQAEAPPASAARLVHAADRSTYPGRGARLRELVRWDLRERVRATTATSLALAAIAVMVFALYPSIAVSIGILEVPDGVAELLGGADFGSLPGWINTELVSILGPGSLLAFGAVLGAGYLAGREESGVAGVVLATPAHHRTVVVAAALASSLLVAVVATAQLVGFVVGDLLVDADLPIGAVVATNVHLLTVGLFGAGSSLAVGALTGRRSLTLGVVGTVGVVGFLLQGLAAAVPGLSWLDALSVFSWSVGHRPLLHGLDPAGLLAVLGATAVCTAVAVLSWERRDLTG